MSVAGEVEAFITNQIAAGEEIGPLEHDTDLLAGEVVDSMGIVELIAFLERRYSIKVTDEDLDPENFRCVSSIAAFVERRKAAGQRA